MTTIDLNVILENMPVAYALHEMIYDETGNPVDYRFVKVNKHFEKLTGLSAGELEGKACMKLFPETEKYWIDFFEECICTQKTNQYEDFSTALNGYFQVTAFSPSPGRFVTMTTDVTSQVEKRLELIRNEQRYRLSQEVGKTGSWVYDIRDKKYWNSLEFRRIFGITEQDENVNRDVEACIVNNDYVTNALTNLIEKGITYDIEFEIIRKNDGQRRILNSKARVEYDSANLPVNVYGYLIDITDHKHFVDRVESSEAIAKESLAKFEKIFANNPAIMMLIDLENHRYTDVNNSFLRHLEYTREEVLDKTPVELGIILAEDIEAFRYVGRAIYQKKSVEDFVVRLKAKSGKIMTGFFSSQVIETNGKEFGLGVFIDITERKYYENLLKTNALNLKKLLEFSRIFIEPFKDEPECESILNMVRVLSGANHVFFNVLTNQHSNVKCMSSDSITNVELDNIFGVDLLSHKWERNTETDKLWINNKSTRFSSLTFLRGFGVDKAIVEDLVRRFNIEFAVLIRIEGTQKVEGNFLLFFEKGNEFINSEIVEIFSYQVGQYMERFYTEMALKSKMSEMERFYKLSVNRELNMIELKKEINALLGELGREAKYTIVSNQ